MPSCFHKDTYFQMMLLCAFIDAVDRKEDMYITIALSFLMQTNGDNFNKMCTLHITKAKNMDMGLLIRNTYKKII